jgi:hypothetical protein
MYEHVRAQLDARGVEQAYLVESVGHGLDVRAHDLSAVLAECELCSRITVRDHTKGTHPRAEVTRTVKLSGRDLLEETKVNP